MLLHTSAWPCGQGGLQPLFCSLTAQLASVVLEFLHETFCSWSSSSGSLGCIVDSRHFLICLILSAADAKNVCEFFHSSFHILPPPLLFNPKTIPFFDYIETPHRSALSVWTLLPRLFCLNFPLPTAVSSPLSWFVILRRYWWKTSIYSEYFTAKKLSTRR